MQARGCMRLAREKCAADPQAEVHDEWEYELSRADALGHERLLRDEPTAGAFGEKPRYSQGMREAEEMAGLAPQEGGAWHPYRRMWATTRKGLPRAGRGRGGWVEDRPGRAGHLHTARRRDDVGGGLRRR